MTDPHATWIVGRGSLAAGLAALASRDRPVELMARLPGSGNPDVDSGGIVSAGTPAAIVIASDGWVRLVDDAARAHAQQNRSGWMTVCVEMGSAVITPLELPGESGCLGCLDLRRRRAAQDAPLRAAVLAEYGDRLAAAGSPLLTDTAIQTVWSQVRAQLDRAESSGTALAIAERRHLKVVDLRTLSVEEHFFLPDPLCNVCGRRPDDSSELARLILRPRPRLNSQSARVRDMVDALDQLVDAYVDPETGVIRELKRGEQGGLVVAGALLPLRGTDGIEPGVGRGRDYDTSSAVAILEAMERYGGTEPGGRMPTVRASFDEVAEVALDPRELGTHDETAYRQDGFDFTPFDPGQPLTWVWAHSFRAGEPILVPLTVAYYHLRTLGQAEPRSLYEISNGCALGGCLEEAILHGLLEVLERDAFLMTWYCRLPAPRLEIDDRAGVDLRMRIAAVEWESGYQVELYDITLEHGVPCVAVVAARRSEDQDGPALVCAAGSALSHQQAALNAVSEVGPLLYDLKEQWPQRRTEAAAMAEDSDLVHTMPHHSVLYGDDIAAGRLDFLRGSGRTTKFPASGDPEFSDPDLASVLRAVVDRVLAAGMDVVVVNQTASEHDIAELSCVKVLVPGALSMTFGHRFRRVQGLSRPLEVPHRLGLAPAPLTPEDLNPYPHPFP